jgi:hypothetical protein
MKRRWFWVVLMAGCAGGPTTPDETIVMSAADKSDNIFMQTLGMHFRSASRVDALGDRVGHSTVLSHDAASVQIEADQLLTTLHASHPDLTIAVTQGTLAGFSYQNAFTLDVRRAGSHDAWYPLSTDEQGNARLYSRVSFIANSASGAVTASYLDAGLVDDDYGAGTVDLFPAKNPLAALELRIVPLVLWNYGEWDDGDYDYALTLSSSGARGLAPHAVAGSHQKMIMNGDSDYAAVSIFARQLDEMTFSDDLLSVALGVGAARAISRPTDYSCYYDLGVTPDVGAMKRFYGVDFCDEAPFVIPAGSL